MAGASSLAPRHSLKVGNVPLGSREWAKSTFPTGSNLGPVGGSIPLKMGSLVLVETGPEFRLDRDRDLSTYSLLEKTRNLNHDRTRIFFTPWPTRRFAYALVGVLP
jgi:hypothetical protein